MTAVIRLEQHSGPPQLPRTPLPLGPYLLQRLAFLRGEVTEILLSCPLSPRFRVFLLSHATVSRFTPQNHPDRVLVVSHTGVEG